MPGPTSSSRSVTVAALLAVAAAVVVAMDPAALLGTRVFAPVDALKAFEPWRTFSLDGPANALLTDPVNGVLPKLEEIRTRLWAGDMPLWTSLLGTGLPLITLPQTGALSVMNLPHLLAPETAAPALAKALEIAAAVGFTMLWLRRLGGSRLAGVLAGAAFALSGFQVVWQGWQHTQTAAVIPALFWAVEYAVQERRLRAAIPLALATAAILLAGFPSIALWALQATGIYAVVRVVASRPDWRRRFRDLSALAGATLVGAGLAAVQVLPFLSFVGARDTAARATFADAHLPLQALATLVAPEAYGNPTEKVTHGSLHFIGTQGYVGVVVLVLALVGAVAGTRALARRRGARTFLVAATLVLGVLVYHGGILLDVLAPIPPYGVNLVTRQRVIMALLLAVLAGVGFDGLRHGVAHRLRGARLAVVLAAGAGVAVLLGVALADVSAVAAAAGHGDHFTSEMVALAAVGGGALVAGVLAAVGRRAVAAMMLFALVLLPAADFARDYWVTPPAADHFPVTPAHEATIDRLGHDRLVAGGRAMEPGSTEFYGIASVTAHTFQLPALAAMLEQVDHRALARETFPMLTPGADTATSPVLDRLGARLYVQADTEPVIGSRPPRPAADGHDRLEVGETVSLPAPSGPLRAVTVRAPRIAATPGRAKWLHVEVLDDGGAVLADGARRLHERVRPGLLDVGLVWPGGAARAAPSGASLRIALVGGSARDAGAGAGGMGGDGDGDGGGDGWIELATAGGAPSVTPVRPADDGLALVHVGGVQLYERTRALPRIRWAGRARLATEPSTRLGLLSGGVLDDDEVVLAAPPVPPAGGGEAGLTVTEDSGDTVAVTVEADTDGLVVVADALTESGWAATVDGAPVPIRTADHAGAAVAVPAGRHEIVFSYRPEAFTAGLALSAASLAAVVIAAVAGRRRGETEGRPA